MPCAITLQQKEKSVDSSCLAYNRDILRSESSCALIRDVGFVFHAPPVSILELLLLCMGRGSICLGPLSALLQDWCISCVNLCDDFDRLHSVYSEMPINFLSLSLDGLCSESNTEPLSQNFSISLRTALRWGTGISGNFQQIAPTLNQCIYCLLERRIQQEKHIRQLKEP
jgi:hypothetical protein